MYLDKILAKHRETALADTRKLEELISSAKKTSPSRGFTDRLRRDSVEKMAVIAEIKRRSPSRGVLNQNLQVSETAEQYRRGGASCISVLTDAEFFGGSKSDLDDARSAVDLPVLRKDFTVSSKDVCDAKLMNADCVLLIVAALDKSELAEFHGLATELGLDVLVEIHDETELEIALEIEASLIGVNQRDLKTFEVDHRRAVRMARLMPANVVRVAESGVKTRADAQSLRDAGYHAVLVGESLVTSGDIVKSVSELGV
ncbi:MAG: indole-3-glycerol phosphate synthase TrpC [Actinomycetota bacterium]|nr:indole-3-glycerol phosphate synthase TrpC [Actinomycetota bacterium]